MAIINSSEYRSVSKDFPLDNVLMISGNRILRVHLNTGSYDVIIELPDLASAGLLSSTAAADEKKLEDQDKLKWDMAVRGPGQVIILDSSGKQLETYNIPKDCKDKDITFYRIASGRAIIKTEPDYRTPGALTWINESGKSVRHEITDPPRPISNTPKSISWLMFSVMPEPVVIGGILFVASGVQYHEMKLEGEVSYSGLEGQFLQKFYHR